MTSLCPLNSFSAGKVLLSSGGTFLLLRCHLYVGVTKAATLPTANRQWDEKISRPAIRKAADPLLLRCICITAPFSARNPRQLLLGHRPRWYRAAVASASSQAPADDRSGAARFP